MVDEGLLLFFDLHLALQPTCFADFIKLRGVLIKIDEQLVDFDFDVLHRLLLVILALMGLVFAHVRLAVLLLAELLARRLCLLNLEVPVQLLNLLSEQTLPLGLSRARRRLELNLAQKQPLLL